MIFFFSRIIHKKWPIRNLLAKHIRGKYFEFFPLFIGPYVRKYSKNKAVYTAASVADEWTGAENLEKQTDGRMDKWTDG